MTRKDKDIRQKLKEDEKLRETEFNLLIQEYEDIPLEKDDLQDILDYEEQRKAEDEILKQDSSLLTPEDTDEINDLSDIYEDLRVKDIQKFLSESDE